MEYHGKCEHNLGRIHPIAIMSRIDICYTYCHVVTQTVAPTLTALKGLKRCIQYLASHPHKTILYAYGYFYVSNVIRLTWNGNQVEDYTTQKFLKCYKYSVHARILNRRWLVSGIIHTLLGVSVFWKVQIQPDVSY